MNNEDSLLLTTSQAAQLLAMHESSIKRWSNESKLRITKTKGGHRRIPVESLLFFARENDLKSLLLRFQNDDAKVAEAALAAREKGDFQYCVKLVLKWCDEKPAHYLCLLLDYLSNTIEIPIGKIFDRIFAVVLTEIGQRWKDGDLTIAQEHILTRQFLDALYQYRNTYIDSEKSELKLPKAIIGCAEGGQHELAAMFARVLVERQSISVLYLGPNVPFEEFALLQLKQKSSLICISFVPPLSTNDARRCLIILSQFYSSEAPYHLALGGKDLDPMLLEKGVWPFQSLKILSSLESFERWVTSTFETKLLSTPVIPSPK